MLNLSIPKGDFIFLINRVENLALEALALLSFPEWYAPLAFISSIAWIQACRQKDFLDISNIMDNWHSRMNSF